MLSTLARHCIWGTRFLFLVACFLGLYLLRQDAPSLIQKAIYVLTPFAVLYSFQQQGVKNSFSILFSFLKPWGPWIASIVLFIVVHGSSGLSNFLHVILIFCLFYLALYHFKVNKKWALYILGTNVLLLSSAIVLSILFNGLGTTILGVNKNVIIPELAALSVVSLFFYLSNKKFFTSKITQIFLILSVIINLIAVVMSEVRTAILVYLCVFPLLPLISKNLVRKAFPVITVTLLTLVALFFFTGRFQEGWNDLVQYQAGNASSSWGIRIELWKLGLAAFTQNPYFGWGIEPFSRILEHGYYFPVDFYAEHFHCDMLNLLVCGGSVSVLGWLATNIMLIISSSRDPAKIALIATFFAIGIAEQSWASNYSACFVFMVTWVLLNLPRLPNN